MYVSTKAYAHRGQRSTGQSQAGCSPLFLVFMLSLAKLTLCWWYLLTGHTAMTAVSIFSFKKPYKHLSQTVKSVKIHHQSVYSFDYMLHLFNLGTNSCDL